MVISRSAESVGAGTSNRQSRRMLIGRELSHGKWQPAR
jgi:hypothetical protein